eukprot:CAMPEP_0203987676 /NCGR_PEP_ID=MMETSP0360-20130528/6946_1 /ASSEMBLY_ACC=CAM_ASM_000342 /TAXON_ID=268821 /ORGANISM="Scrippsiella Hangoei, Strain SHTV-5" /LENGTH=173 /DNA_ID=CAMNT_0050927345 /DNA_START=114 /DNA_END=636 /DNA_ORIENTATION=-
MAQTPNLAVMFAAKSRELLHVQPSPPRRVHVSDAKVNTLLCKERQGSLEHAPDGLDSPQVQMYVVRPLCERVGMKVHLRGIHRQRYFYLFGVDQLWQLILPKNVDKGAHAGPRPQQVDGRNGHAHLPTVVHKVLIRSACSPKLIHEMRRPGDHSEALTEWVLQVAEIRQHDKC